MDYLGKRIVRPKVVTKITARGERRRQCRGAIRSIGSIPMHPNTPLSERPALSGLAPQGTKAARGTAILPMAPWSVPNQICRVALSNVM